MTQLNGEEFWRDTINSLRGPFPEIGADPPIEEIAKIEEPEKELINGIDQNSSGNLSKITMDVYFFMDDDTHKYYMMQSQTMTDYGELTLKKAIEMVKRKQKRNKG